MTEPKITLVPAYYAVDPYDETKETIFIISIKFYDKDNNARLPPAVEKAIDKVIDITGKEGVIILDIRDDTDFTKINDFIKKVMDHKEAFLLFSVFNDILSEKLMNYITQSFNTYLVREVTQ